MKYKMVIFDMDGTILNTLEDLADSVNFALRVYHMPERTIEEVRRFVGNGIKKLVERAVPDNTPEKETREVFETFQDYYRKHCAVKTRPYEGVIETIQALRKNGIRTAVVSNKADYAVKSLCEEYFYGLFDVAIGETEDRRRKPYPDSVYAALEQVHLELEEAVYVGDSEVDFQTAKNAGMDVIMVGWGFRDEGYMKEQGAEFVIHNPNEILDYVL